MGEGVYVILGAIAILVIGMLIKTGRKTDADEPAPAPAPLASAASDEEDEIAAVIAAALAAFEAETGKKGRVMKAAAVKPSSVSLWNMMAVRENVINRGR